MKKQKRCCRNCSKEFSVYFSEIKKGNGYFCSRSCYYVHRHGENNNKWKGGISLKNNICIGCGVETSDYRYKRCIACANIEYKKGKKLSEEHKIKCTAHFVVKKGSDCNFWKGGVSTLQTMIRNLLENRNWKKSVFKKDNYICQECYKRGGYLEAHHLNPFAKICEEFLSEYSQFSPMEDKETLARIAQSYKPFWDISNGQTLCKECHKKTRKIINT